MPIISGGSGSGGGSSGTFFRTTTTTTVASSVALTDLLAGAITIPGGSLAANGLLRIDIWGDFLNNTGGNQAKPRYQLALGGTTLFDVATGPNMGASATRSLFHAYCTIMQTATNVQHCSLHMDHSSINSFVSTNGAFTTGQGNWTIMTALSPGNWIAWAENVAAIDSTAPMALTFSVQNALSDPNYVTRGLCAIVELL